MIAALTDHLWQSTIFVIAAALLAAALRKNAAEVRHRIWLVASLKFLVPLSLLMSVGAALPVATTPVTPVAPEAVPDLSLAVDRITQPFASEAVFSIAAAPETVIRWVPLLLTAVWAAGFIAVVFMRIRDWRRIEAALRASSPLCVDAPVPVRSAPGLLEPGVVGLWRSVLLVPEGIETQLTRKQLGSVLLHEVAHVERRDNLTSALHMIVEAVFWFYPPVWFVGARLVDERERACDEYVLRRSGDPTTYAESILHVTRLYVESPIACVSGVSGADLKKRIANIMINRTGLQLNPVRKAALIMAALVAVVLPIAAGVLVSPVRASAGAAQSAQANSSAQQAVFDVVSIKPCVPNRPPAGPAAPAGFRRGGAPYHATVSPGYAYWDCVTLAQLVDQAYADADHPLLNIITNPRQDLGRNQPKRVRGGPSWVEAEKFTIEVKAPVELTRPALSTGSSRAVPSLPPAMAQALRAALEDRFKVQVRRVTEEQPMYALTIAKGGLNKQLITEPVKGDCMTTAEYSAAVAAGNVPPLDDLKLCGRYHSSLEHGLRFSSFTFQGLALALSGMMDLYVLDRTGLDAPFNFTIKTNSSEGGSADLMFSRVLERMGLKLEPTKGPAEYLFIERAERPTPNLLGLVNQPELRNQGELQGPNR